MRTTAEHTEAINRRNAARTVDAFLTYAAQPSEDWREDALCAQMPDPDAWHPPKGGSAREPKKVCGMCIVREQCLAYALEHQVPHGIWGGKTERERRAILAQAPPPPRTEQTDAEVLGLLDAGMPINEIAQVLGISRAAVDKRLLRARRRRGAA